MASLRPPRLPALKRQATGKAKPKAIGKANPVTPSDRQYPWGGPAIRKGKQG